MFLLLRKRRYCLTILLTVFLAVFVKVAFSHANSKPENQEESVPEEDFRPTHEWQEIKPGQKIPKGLHVRINLETGAKEAKLLDETQDSKPPSSALLSVSKPSESTETPSDTPSPDELKQFLRKIKDEASHVDTDQSFRSYEEIKKDFAELQVNVKTDAEVIANLLESYKKTTDDNERASILTDFEYYIHQVDNAKDFAKTDSLTQLIIPALNSSNAELRSAAALFLGSAAQSNPSFQVACVEISVLPHLIRLLSFDSDNVVQRRAMYAISSIIRNFPLAQKQFIHQGGLSAFARVFESDAAELQTLQLKVVTLLHDILLEFRQLPDLTNVTSSDINGTESENATSAPEDIDAEAAIIKALLDNRQSKQFSVKQQEDALLRQKILQYSDIHFEETLVEQGWCERIPKLLGSRPTDRQARREDLSSVLSDHPIRMEHDVLEKVLNCMQTLAPSCRQAFIPYVPLLQEYRKRYSELSVRENQLDQSTFHYYTELLHLCTSLLEAMSKSQSKRDEL